MLNARCSMLSAKRPKTARRGAPERGAHRAASPGRLVYADQEVPEQGLGAELSTISLVASKTVVSVAPFESAKSAPELYRSLRKAQPYWKPGRRQYERLVPLAQD